MDVRVDDFNQALIARDLCFGWQNVNQVPRHVACFDLRTQTGQASLGFVFVDDLYAGLFGPRIMVGALLAGRVGTAPRYDG